MTDIALRAGRWIRGGSLLNLLRTEWVLVVLAAAAGTVVAIPELREAAVATLSDAYIQVSVFVGVTLAIFYGLERGAKVDLADLLDRFRFWQVPIAALLGATPGCGAEILLVTQYTRGVVSFGAIVAALTATMGDAAFLIIAKDPHSAAIVIGLCTVAAIVVGFIVNWLHPEGIGALKREIAANVACDVPVAADERPGPVRLAAEKLWLVLFVPGLALGVLVSMFQVDVDGWFGAYAALEPTKWFGFAGAVLCIAMFLTRRDARGYGGIDPRSTMSLPPARRMIVDTNFVTFWVFLGFFGYEVVAHFTGNGVENWLQASQVVLPLVATMVGLIPGCGVMVLTTTLFLQHQIPLSAMISAAISTDGDALFPAIAMAPRAAVVATLYTAVPALVMGYGWYLLME
ncbi:MAG TPA: putative manganese transporter [Microvirga sp.]|nr:putative manganese transporter [Microvirga sp.]